MEKVSKDGVITIEESKTMKTELDLVEGMQFDRGSAFPARTDADSGRNLVYDPDEISSHPSVSGHAAYIV